MHEYGSHDFRRFVYTLGLVKGLEGKCLEFGANPYFTTMLLERFTKLELSLANYFGSFPVCIHTQDIIYTDDANGVKKTKPFSYQYFNVENDPFPYVEIGSLEPV